jgi:hypothetical protein
VKGRAAGATTVTVTVTKNEILTALNKPDLVHLEGMGSRTRPLVTHGGNAKRGS